MVSFPAQPFLGTPSPAPGTQLLFPGFESLKPCILVDKNHFPQLALDFPILELTLSLVHSLKYFDKEDFLCLILLLTAFHPYCAVLSVVRESFKLHITENKSFKSIVVVNCTRVVDSDKS